MNSESTQVDPDDMLYLEKYVTFFNDDQQSQSSQAQIIGISLKGARILLDKASSEVGARVSFTLSFNVDRVRNVTLLGGTVVDLVDDPDSGAQSLLIQFQGLDKDDINMLHLYVYQLMLREQGLIE